MVKRLAKNSEKMDNVLYDIFFAKIVLLRLADLEKVSNENLPLAPTNSKIDISNVGFHGLL